MPLNKKMYKRVVGLHLAGLPMIDTVKTIIQLAKHPSDAAESIHEFYKAPNYGLPIPEKKEKR